MFHREEGEKNPDKKKSFFFFFAFFTEKSTIFLIFFLLFIKNNAIITKETDLLERLKRKVSVERAKKWSRIVSKENLKRKKNCKGQVLAEYVTMAVMAFTIVLVLFFLLAVFAEYNWRMTALLGWEP